MLPEMILPDWFARLGLTAWPLALCSVAALAIVSDRLVFIVRCLLSRKQTQAHLVDTLDDNRRHAKPIRDEISSLMIAELHADYFSGIQSLRMIATISPMLGLFGTILGVVSAFRAIAANVGPVSPHMIADGLWEAMLTTAVGLAIALPSVVTAYLFQQFASRQINNLSMLLNKQSLVYEMQDSDTMDAQPPQHVKAAE